MRRHYAAVALTTLVLLAPVGRAWAHEGEEGVSASDSIQEAIAIIASQPEQLDLIADKIGDALAANDQSGVVRVIAIIGLIVYSAAQPVASHIGM